MLIWLATFFAVSLALICAVRWSLKRLRKRRQEQLKAIEARCGEIPQDLGLPLTWRTSPTTCDASDYRSVQLLQWTLPLGILAAGLMWSATASAGWDWNGAVFGTLAALLTFLTLTVWMSWRCQTTMPLQSRRLALALRCWAIRSNAGVECRTALEQAARQLRRFDPELSRLLEAAAGVQDQGDQLQRAFSLCGTGISAQLAEILAGKIADPCSALSRLADRLDAYYLNQVLKRTRLIESWLKYPLALCLVPAVNLLLFGPAIADLLEKFGTVRPPAPVQAQPLEALSSDPPTP